jgi:hypothetical protein
MQEATKMLNRSSKYILGLFISLNKKLANKDSFSILITKM